MRENCSVVILTKTLKLKTEFLYCSAKIDYAKHIHFKIAIFKRFSVHFNRNHPDYEKIINALYCILSSYCVFKT